MKLIVKPNDLHKQINNIFRILPEEFKEGKLLIEFWFRNGMVLTFEDLEAKKTVVAKKIVFAKRNYGEIRRIYLNFNSMN